MGLARIKTGDRVIVIAGRDKGRIGKVLRVLPDAGRAVVENVNMVKKHQKRTQQTPQGGIVSKEAPIHISNIMLFDDKKGARTRVGTGTDKDGRKVRIARGSETVID